MEDKIRDKYFTVQGWMAADHKLKGLDLMVYAILYGFCQGTKSFFFGSLQYLADLTGSSRRGVQEALKKLEEKKLVKRFGIHPEFSTIQYYAYSKPYDEKEGIQKMYDPHTENVREGIQKMYDPHTENVHNNNSNNINNNNSNNIDRTPEKNKRFQKPTLEEVKAYCEERGNNIDPEKFIDYYNSNGWKVGKSSMKDWKATIRNWERNEKERNKPKLSPTMNDPDKLFF